MNKYKPLQHSNIEARQTDEVISVDVERVGTVETVSWCKWRVEGIPELNGVATFQVNA